MKWIEFSKEAPQDGEAVWVWNIEEQKQMLFKYETSEFVLENFQAFNEIYPIWAKLNEKE